MAGGLCVLICRFITATDLILFLSFITTIHLTMKQLIVAVCFFCILSCSKSGDDTDPGGEPGPGPGPGGTTELTITSITPNSAEIVPVTINGTGFNTTAASNTVHISGKPATITNATATSLTITLPDNLDAGDHDVRVGANGKVVTKEKGFHLIGWMVTNFTGTGVQSQLPGSPTVATFHMPKGIVKDAAGNFYVGDWGMVRKISPDGEVSLYAGFTISGYVDNDDPTRARFNQISSIAIDRNNNLYVCDQWNHAIRKIDSDRKVTTIAGNGEMGDVNGRGADAQFSQPYGITINAAGTHLYVGDYGNNKIRRIDLANNTVSTFAGDGTGVRKDHTTNPLEAGIVRPGNLVFDKDNNLLITEKGGGRIRKITPGGAVSTLGGNPNEGENGVVPNHLAIDSDGNIYVTCAESMKVRKYAPNGSWTNFAGGFGGPVGQDNSNGPANLAVFKIPEGIWLTEDAQKNKVFFVVDALNRKIKKISRQ